MSLWSYYIFFFFFQAEDGIRDLTVTGVQTCALPILNELGGLGRSAELAEESLRLTTLRYKGGEATVLEVVDAQTTYAQSNAAYQDGAVRYRAALANLQTLTGVLTAP